MWLPHETLLATQSCENVGQRNLMVNVPPSPSHPAGLVGYGFPMGRCWGSEVNLHDLRAGMYRSRLQSHLERFYGSQFSPEPLGRSESSGFQWDLLSLRR